MNDMLGHSFDAVVNDIFIALARQAETARQPPNWTTVQRLQTTTSNRATAVATRG